jgi:TerC family integral membrane protein
MDISTAVWWITIVVTITVLTFDVVIVGRRPHEPSMKECSIYIGIYSTLAVLFGLWIWAAYGGRFAGEFYAGWLTEYSLSVDNLFVFIIIMSRFGVPRKYQQEALLVGIILALVFRGIFIAIGAVAIERISWIFYIFGAFLIYTAWSLATHDEDEYEENRLIKFTQQRLNATDQWHGSRSSSRRTASGSSPRCWSSSSRSGPPTSCSRSTRSRRSTGSPGAVPGADREHLRADGPAAALLPARRPCWSGWSTCPTGCRSSSPSSA